MMKSEHALMALLRIHFPSFYVHLIFIISFSGGFYDDDMAEECVHLNKQ